MLVVALLLTSSSGSGSGGSGLCGSITGAWCGGSGLWFPFVIPRAEAKVHPVWFIRNAWKFSFLNFLGKVHSHFLFSKIPTIFYILKWHCQSQTGNGGTGKIQKALVGKGVLRVSWMHFYFFIITMPFYDWFTLLSIPTQYHWPKPKFHGINEQKYY